MSLSKISDITYETKIVDLDIFDGRSIEDPVRMGMPFTKS